MKWFLSVLLLIADLGLTRMFNSVEMVASGKLAANQFNNSDLDYILLQSGTQIMSGSGILVNVICLGLLLLVWKSEIKKLIKGDK
jgi:hypothetical protein